MLKLHKLLELRSSSLSELAAAKLGLWELGASCSTFTAYSFKYWRTQNQLFLQVPSWAAKKIMLLVY